MIRAEPTASATTASPERDWVSETAAKWVSKWLDYVWMLREATFHPRRLAESWAAGEPARMGPAAFLGVSAGLLAMEIKVLGKLGLDEVSSESFWGHLAYAVVPYLYYLLLAALCHLLMKLLGSERKLLSTSALALYTGAGPTTLALMIVFLPAHTLIHRFDLQLGSRWEFGMLVVLTWLKAGAFAIPFSVSVGSLHRRAAWIVFLLLVVFITAAAVLIGMTGLGGRVPTAIPQPVVSVAKGEWYIRL